MALHVGDVKAVIRLTSTKDISAQTLLKIEYIRPDGVRGVWTAAVNGTTGVQYTTLSKADLPVAGTWRFFGYAELSGGWKGHCTEAEIEVLPVA